MKRTPGPCTLAFFLSACSFDGSGQGDERGSAGPPAESSGGGSEGSGGLESSGGQGVTTGGVGMSGSSGAVDETTGADPSVGTEPAGTTGPSTTLPPETTTGVDETTTGDGTTTDPGTSGPMTTDSTTGGDNACPGPIVKIIEKVEEAGVEWPMVKEQSQMGEGTIASSPQAEWGTVEFAVEIPCVDTFKVWGRVFDDDPGTHQSNDPDSYYVRVDGGPEITWYYGCQTTMDQTKWAWHLTRGVNGNQCGDQYDWMLPLGPGTHYIRFRNREYERGGGVRASIARILVTNDPNFVPTVE